VRGNGGGGLRHQRTNGRVGPESQVTAGVPGPGLVQEDVGGVAVVVVLEVLTDELVEEEVLRGELRRGRRRLVQGREKLRRADGG